MEKDKPQNPIDYEVAEENPWMDEGGVGGSSSTDADEKNQAKRLCYVITAILILVVTAIILSVI